MVKLLPVLLIFIAYFLDHKTKTEKSRLAVLTQARYASNMNADAANSFESELTTLNDLSVTRISIGFGSNSNIQRGSALDLIDKIPNKERLDLLPRQVLTADDLTQLLRNLCLESTPNPTNYPTSQPTAVPTPVPTDYLTGSPSNSPTKGPAAEPTAQLATMEPSSSPNDLDPTPPPIMIYTLRGLRWVRAVRVSG